MAVKLEKIYQDCAHPDPQIQTFALMSITRLSPQLVDAPELIGQILLRVKGLVSSTNPDVVFLARKATNHLEGHFEELLTPPPPQTPVESPASGPGSVPTDSRPCPPIRVEGTSTSPETEGSIDRPAISGPEPLPAAGPRPARELSREQILELLPVTTNPVYLASLVIALVTKGTAKEIETIRPFLSHADDRVRSNALEVIQAHGAHEHVDLIVPLLNDRSNRVVGNACMALARFDHPEVPRKLAAMLDSRLVSMRETATYVLSTLNAEYAEALLIRASADPYEGVRLRAVRSLARFITRESVSALKKALSDMDINVCEGASDSLKQIKEVLRTRKVQEATPPLPVEKPTATAQESPPGTPPPPRPEPQTALAPVESHAPNSFDRDLDPAPSLPQEEGHRPAVRSEVPETPSAQPQEVPSERDLIYREFGGVVFHLCRTNQITNELLDGIFYEILRYQDFLRAYQAKLTQERDDTIQQAVTKLEEKVKLSLGNLGRQAAVLFEGKQILVPEKEKANLLGFLDRLRKARRGQSPG